MAAPSSKGATDATTSPSVRAISVRRLGAALAVLTATVWGPGSMGGIVALVVGGIAAVTALSGYCPLYRLCHISTAHPHSGPRSQMHAACS
jgi:hypothetical protein